MKGIRNEKFWDSLVINTMEVKLTTTDAMAWTHYKNEWRENPKEGFQIKAKEKHPRRIIRPIWKKQVWKGNTQKEEES